MTRTFTTATAIATALIAISPAGHAGQMINVPTPQVNVAPNVPRPRVNLPAVTPRPDTSRVLKRDDADDGAQKRERAAEKREPKRTRTSSKKTEEKDRTDALADRAPVPPAFPGTLVKAMDVPPLNPRPEPDAAPAPGPLPTDDGGADDGHAGNLGDAGEIDTGGSGGDAAGSGNGAPFGRNDADRLREQFRGGTGLEKAEELARLKELQELGWLRFGDSAFGGDGDCGPGVSLPAGTDLPGLGCGSGDVPEADSRRGDDGGFASGLPMDPDRGHGGYPMPSPDDGMGSNNKHPGARIGGGGGSAKGSAGVKPFGTGRVSQDSGGAAGANAGSDSGSGGGTVELAVGPNGGTEETQKDEDGTVQKVTVRDSEGNTTYRAERQDDGTYREVSLVAESDDGTQVWGSAVVDKPYGKPSSHEIVILRPSGSDGGGEAGQPDPRGPQTGGGAGGDCLTLGIRCDVAEDESGDTWGEKMKEWARKNGGDSLTPGEIMEMVGQPVPTDPWSESATGAVADPRGVAGLTPCLDTPDGCGAPSDAGVAGAGAAVELGEVGIDTSIAGLTPPCSESPGGCAASGAVGTAVESGAGEEVR